jgi:hypothetical protein
MAGAGMSIAAGYPTAASLTQLFLQEMNIAAPESDVLSRHGFAAVVQSFEKQFGRKSLVDRISGALLHSDAFGPTKAHMAAVRLFDTIVTTNFDLLFEAACTAQGFSSFVVTPADLPTSIKPRKGPTIFKIDGSIEKPKSLVLTNEDAAAVEVTWIWNSIRERLAGNPLIVVGHALRDVSARRVPGEGLHAGGAYVTPFLSGAETMLLQQYGLDGVRADADSFMTAYEVALASRKD